VGGEDGTVTYSILTEFLEDRKDIVERCVPSKGIVLKVDNMYTTLVNKMLFLKVILLFNSLFLELIFLFNSTPTQRTEKLLPQWSFMLVSCPRILFDFLEMC
jgi:hypothetical protein